MRNPQSDYELGKALHLEYESEASQRWGLTAGQPAARKRQPVQRLSKRAIWLTGNALVNLGIRLQGYGQETLQVKQVCHQ